MPARHPLPRTWLLTDERQGDALWTALRRLPPGSGVIVRHYGLREPERRRLFRRIRGIARSRSLIMFLAGSAEQAREWNADGVYSGGDMGAARFMPWAASVHDLREIRRAEQLGAAMLLLSPLFPTRSHPGGKALRPYRFGQLTRATHLPVIALGGVQQRDAVLMKKIGAYGWAGIDAFIPKAREIRI